MSIRVESDPTVTYAYQQNGVPVIRAIQITSCTNAILDDLTLSLTADPPFAMMYTTHISRLHPGTILNLQTPDLQLSAVFLSSLTERVRGHLLVQVMGAGRVLGSAQVQIDILAVNEWNGISSVPEILAAFIMPNHPVVEGLLHQAGTLLSGMVPGLSLSGYVTQSRRDVYLMAAAIYEAVQELSIVYSHAPASFETTGQQIRLPDRILETKIGNCLDISCLVAGCLEQAGLHPLIIITEGHAFCGVWLDNESFADPALDDLCTLRKRVDLGEICVFESTAVTCSSPRVLFEESVRMGTHLLTDEERFRVVIDVHRTRVGIHRVCPLALQVRPGLTESLSYVDSLPVSTLPCLIPRAPVQISEYQDQESRDTPGSRLAAWKRHLLDLSNRNQLLKFHETRQNLQVLCSDLSSLVVSLSKGDSLKVLPLPDRPLQAISPADIPDHTSDFLIRELAARRLYADMTAPSLHERLLQISRTARTSIAETGAPTLYLALGFLSWYEEGSQTPQLAPLVLLPLEMERRSYRDGFTIRLGNEEPRINGTLLHRLHTDYGITFPGLDTLPGDEQGIYISLILQTFRHHIRDIPGWDILDNAVIGHFSFSKYLMWRDLDAFGQSLLTHPLIAGFVDPTLAFFGRNLQVDPGSMDDLCHPSDLFLPMSADSSQMAAVRAAGTGESFVLYGPPGTGKSQTITNIIADSLARGKTVLFVAEKKVALDVVHDRLRASGIGRFCLDLHSNTSSKREVLRQFTRGEESLHPEAHNLWLQQTERLRAVRAELNAYVQALHFQHTTGESYYHGISRLSSLRHLPFLPLSFPDFSVMDAHDLARLSDLVRRVMIAGMQSGHPSRHPWNTVHGGVWSIQWKNQVSAAISLLIELTEELIPLSEELLSLAGCQNDLSLSDLQSLASLLTLLTQEGHPPSRLLAAADPGERISRLREIIAAGRERDDLAWWFASRYQPQALDMDLAGLLDELTALQSSGFLKRWSRSRSLMNTVQSVLAPGYTPDPETLLADIPKIIRYNQRIRALQRVQKGAEALFGQLWRNDSPDWGELELMLDRASRLLEMAMSEAESDVVKARSLLSCWSSLVPNSPSVSDSCISLSSRYLHVFSRFLHARDDLVALVRADCTASFGDGESVRYLQLVLSRLRAWHDHINLLHDWCFWVEVKQQAIEAGLDGLIRYYEEHPDDPVSLQDLFDRSYYQQWTEFIRDRADPLRTFVQAGFEDQISDFRRLDDLCMQVCRDELVSLLSSRVPTGGSPAEQEELALLAHQMQLQRRQLPIRTLLSRIGTILPLLKPCLLMSPISVAQYLEPTLSRFDLVIFDEASQIPVWDAIGVIARGNQVIIVGDPKQLPPSSGFERSDEDEDTDIAELESVLDECIASGVPPLHLTWHYRSRHESLIAFSNYFFYQNGLLTFPSPHQVSAVSLRPIGGTFDRGKTRTNRREAEAVVLEIVSRLRDPARAAASIGVVTFNAAQQDLILSLLEQARRDDPEIDGSFSDDRQEPVFVKNLENVQGDERDVILFSVGFGPDEQGKVSMNFGPLNRDGGERRLNVAITRARTEILVFSSLMPDQIDLSKTRSHGVQLLRDFLQFARLGPSVLADVCSGGPAAGDFPLEEEIATRLRALGWVADRSIGCGGYRIDIGVVDPDEPGRYLLGIQTDGPMFTCPLTARDRFRLQDEVLLGLGWNLHRVWSSDWWDNPNREIERIEAAIKEVIMKQSLQPHPLGEEEDECFFIEEEMVDDGGDGHADDLDDQIQPYIRYSPTGLIGSKEEFSRDGADADIITVLSAIVKTEGPVLKEYAMKKVINHWGMRRLGPAISERIESFFGQAGIQVRDEGYGVFLWDRDQDPLAYPSFRVSRLFDPEPRRIEEIAPQEIGNAVRYLQQQNPGISDQELVRGVVRVFGLSRTGSAGERVIRGVMGEIDSDEL